MLTEFFSSPARHRRLFAWFGLLMLLGNALISALIQAWVNSWYGSFYNLAQSAAATAISANASSSLDATPTAEVLAAHADGLAQMWALLRQFLLVAMPAALVSPLMSFITSHYALTWRLCLIDSYLTRWHATDPAASGLEGASQRIHEDTQRFASGLQSGVMTGVTALFQLAVFAPRLVQLGGEVPPPAYLASRLPSEAWLLQVAVTVAVGGFGVAWVVTRHLVTLEVANQQVEARLRKRLVLAEADEALAGSACARGAASTSPADAVAVATQRAARAHDAWRQWRARAAADAADASAQGGKLVKPGQPGHGYLYSKLREKAQASAASAATAKAAAEAADAAVVAAAAAATANAAREPSSYEGLLSELRANYSRIFCNFFGFNLWVGGWSQAVILLPYALCGARLFDLKRPIQMGVLVQVIASDCF